MDINHATNQAQGPNDLVTARQSLNEAGSFHNHAFPRATFSHSSPSGSGSGTQTNQIYVARMFAHLNNMTGDSFSLPSPIVIGSCGSLDQLSIQGGYFWSGDSVDTFCFNDPTRWDIVIPSTPHETTAMTSASPKVIPAHLLPTYHQTTMEDVIAIFNQNKPGIFRLVFRRNRASSLRIPVKLKAVRGGANDNDNGWVLTYLDGTD